MRDGAVPVFVLLILLVVSGAWHVAFYRNLDWAWKERWYVPATLGTVAAAAVAAFVFRYPGLIVGAVFAVVFMYQGIRDIRFCHRCGRTNFLRGNPRPRHCRECGLDLRAEA